MIVKKLILKKIVSGGFLVEFHLVKNEGQYEAALFVNGKHVGGPSLPQPLNPPKENITHWMGNKPSIGLTESEAEVIFKEVSVENEMLKHRKRSGWEEES